MMVLVTIILTSCTGSLSIEEDLNEEIKLAQLQQENLKMQSRESDSVSSTNVGLDPNDPDVPIKDTHDWRTSVNNRN